MVVSHLMWVRGMGPGSSVRAAGTFKQCCCSGHISILFTIQLLNIHLWDFPPSFKTLKFFFFLNLSRQKDAQHFNLLYDIVLFCGDYV